MASIKIRLHKSGLSRSSVFRFLLVGGSSTLLDFILYTALSLHESVTIAKSISMLLASLFSYILNKQFTFEDKNPTDFGYLLRFYTVFFANFAVNVGTNSLLLFMTNWRILAFAIATLAGMAVNYLGQKHFVFQKR